MIPEGSNSQLASDEVIYITHFAPHISISIGEVLVCVVSQLQWSVVADEGVPVVSQIEFMVGWASETLVDGDESAVAWVAHIERT